MPPSAPKANFGRLKPKSKTEDPIEEWRNVSIKDSEKIEYAKEELRNASQAGIEKRRKEKENDPLAIMREAQRNIKPKEKLEKEKSLEEESLEVWREGMSESKFTEDDYKEAMEHYINEQGEKKKGEKNEESDNAKKDNDKGGNSDKGEDKEGDSGEKTKTRSGAEMANEGDAEFSEMEEEMRKQRGEKSETSHNKEKGGKTAENSEKEKGKTTEELKNELEQSQQDLIKAIEKLEKKKQEVGHFEMLKKMFSKGGWDSRAEIIKERKKFKNDFKTGENDFAEKSDRYYQKLYGDTSENRLKIYEDFFNRKKEIDNKRFEAKIKEDKKKWQEALDRVWKGYKGMSRNEKIVWGTALATIAGLSAGAGVGTVAVAGAWKVGRSLASGALSGKLTDILGRKYVEKGKKKDKEKLFTGLNVDNSEIYKKLQEMAKKDKRRKIGSAAAVGAVTIGMAGGTALAWNNVADVISGKGDLHSLLPSKMDHDMMDDYPNGKAGAGLTKNIPVKDVHDSVGTKPKIDEALEKNPGEVHKPDTSGSSSTEHLNEEITPLKTNKEDILKFKESEGVEIKNDPRGTDIIPPKQFDAMKAEVISESQIEKGVSLGKNGSVWKSLEKVYGNTANDETRIGNLILGFKKDLIQDVMDDNNIPKDILSREKLQMISERIEGRFRSLQPDQIIKITNGQGLEIDGFCDADLENDIKDILKTNLEERPINANDAVPDVQEPLVNPTEEQINIAEEINSSENARTNAGAMAEGMRQAEVGTPSTLEEIYRENIDLVSSNKDFGLDRLRNENWQGFLERRTVADLQNILNEASQAVEGGDPAGFEVRNGIDLETAENLDKFLKKIPNSNSQSFKNALLKNIFSMRNIQ